MATPAYSKRTLVTLSLVLLYIVLNAQADNIGSGRAIAFDGVDDYVDLGNIYDDLNLPLTISAWVYQEEGLTVQNPIFASQDNTPLYNGFWFCVNANNVFAGYGDGQGENNPAFRREKSAALPAARDRWIHVAAVINGAMDIELYVNGKNAGGVYSGTSSLPMASDFPGDLAKIGAFYTNSVRHFFAGKIDELKIFSRSLSEDELRSTMCVKGQGDETSLIGYWTFNETSGNIVKDKSPNQFDGDLQGSPAREYSGAPIGDESAYLYTSDWHQKTAVLNALSVSQIDGNPYGIHLYQVNDLPSQDEGLEITEAVVPYYGVFIAADDLGNTVDIHVNCRVMARKDNSIATWVMPTQELNGISDRIEVVNLTDDFHFSLGEDQTLCLTSPVILNPIANPPDDYHFTWQDGSHHPTFLVEDYGTYWVTVESDCSLASDTIRFSRVAGDIPIAVDLGRDTTLCLTDPVILTPFPDASGIDFTWQDGSKQPTFTVNDYGKYWVDVKANCRSGADTITFTQVMLNTDSIPNVITPNGDARNDYFVIDPGLLPNSIIAIFNRWGGEVFQAHGYQNDWGGDGLASGIYFYTLSGSCITDKKGIIHVVK